VNAAWTNSAQFFFPASSKSTINQHYRRLKSRDILTDASPKQAKNYYTIGLTIERVSQQEAQEAQRTR